jgi:DNA-binding GntR family transcriptional regulator
MAPTLVERAVHVLREEILDGTLAPGDRVHLADAATRLGMSMVPVREALRSLASEGLVRAVPQRGYRVSELSLGDLEDTYRLRLVLDPMATELAVPNMTDGEVAGVRTAFEGLVAAYEANDHMRHARLHRDFHFRIYGPCASPWLLRFLAQLWENSIRYQRLSHRRRGTLQDRAEEHRRILEAVEARDAAGAAERVREHLQLTRRSAATFAEEPVEPAA